ncbi:MAG: L-aspartate oxidase [Magnetococcales bacterium]|nr:L-aspartate oxidase [Magnetococcales bacterium]
MDIALRLSEHGSVVLLSKAEACESNSRYAQGGIAAVLNPDDRRKSHEADTHTAGVGLCNTDTVRFVVKNGQKAIQHLIDLGVSFTKDEQNHEAYHLTREGGHSARRVIHNADATGKTVVETLLQQVKKHPDIQLIQNQISIDLVTSHKLGQYLPGQPNRCLGGHVLDIKTGQVNTFRARFVILATGGAGKVYLYTSNPDIATGDGIAMAYRAGCRVANMEFIQFHPTCLFHPQAKSFLVSEAVRGEGGRLILANGEAFMQRHDPRGELAPRDIVARAIDFEMKRTGDDCVFLDITHKGAEFIKSHFPTIFEKCASLGIDMTKEPIPVVPAAHYTCGGIVTHLSAKTDIHGLYAIGETAHTGLHGACRLASNSLLECLVFSEAAYKDIVRHLQETPKRPLESIPLWDSFDTTPCEEAVLISHDWDEIRRFMWNYVGIVRSDHRLARARRRIEMLRQEINQYYWNCKITQDLVELRNIAVVAELIIRSALNRKESRGLHYTTNYPDLDEACNKDTILPISSP